MGIFGSIAGAVGKVGGGFMSGGPLGAGLAGMSVLGGMQAQKGQNQAQDEAKRRYAELHGLITGQMQNAPSAWENQMQSFLGKMSPMSQLPNAAQQGSQDALMQMMNRDPAAQLGQAGTTLADLSATGGAQNIQSLIDSIQGVQGQDLNNQVAGLRGKSTSLGQRFGSAAGKNEAILRSNLGAKNNASLADVINQSRESSQNRRLQASGTLGGLLQAGQGQQFNAASQLGQLGLGGAQLNSQNMQNFMQNQLQGMQMGGSMMNQRQGQNSNLLALLGGQPAQQAANMNPLMGGLQEAAFMPMIAQQMQGLAGKKGMAGAGTPFSPAVNNGSYQTPSWLKPKW